jgi:NAD(P)-dependent dehydrogenase (short-subunit alcohol dehydrogenase family)
MMAAPNLDYLSIGELISLEGRVAVVTGGVKGIGLGVARRLAEAGADVLLADVDDERGPQAALELAEHGGKALYQKVDVRNPDKVEAAADAAVSELGGLDIWANIAGVYPVKADEFQVTRALGDTEWARMIGINLTGTFHGARAVARRMIDAGKGGVIINIQSTTTQKVPAPGFSHYVASKGGIGALTKSLAVELGPHGIRVLSISPTMVATPGNARAEAGPHGGIRQCRQSARAQRLTAAAGPDRDRGRDRACGPVPGERPCGNHDGQCRRCGCGRSCRLIDAPLTVITGLPRTRLSARAQA